MGASRRGGVHVLLVVSDSTVERAIEDAFRRSRIEVRVTALASASETIAYLHGRGEYAGEPQPDTVVIDLECSGIDGHALLEEIKGDAALRRVPVLVIAPVDSGADVRQSYDLQANAVLDRPTTQAEYDDLVQAFEQFWIDRVRLPPQ